jgi:hypothetical protein
MPSRAYCAISFVTVSLSPFPHAAESVLASARRTAFGSALMTSIKVRPAPEGRRVPSSHLRTVPTAVLIKEQNKGEIEVFILDQVLTALPTPPFTDDEKQAVAGNVYAHVWQQAMSGEFATVM